MPGISIFLLHCSEFSSQAVVGHHGRNRSGMVNNWKWVKYSRIVRRKADVVLTCLGFSVCSFFQAVRVRVFEVSPLVLSFSSRKDVVCMANSVAFKRRWLSLHFIPLFILIIDYWHLSLTFVLPRH